MVDNEKILLEKCEIYRRQKLKDLTMKIRKLKAENEKLRSYFEGNSVTLDFWKECDITNVVTTDSE